MEPIYQYRRDKLLEMRKDLRQKKKSLKTQVMNHNADIVTMSRLFDSMIEMGGTYRVKLPKKFQSFCRFHKIDCSSSGMALDVFCVGPVPATLLESFYYYILEVLERPAESLNIK